MSVIFISCLESFFGKMSGVAAMAPVEAATAPAEANRLFFKKERRFETGSSILLGFPFDDPNIGVFDRFCISEMILVNSKFIPHGIIDFLIGRGN